MNKKIDQLNNIAAIAAAVGFVATLPGAVMLALANPGIATITYGSTLMSGIFGTALDYSHALANGSKGELFALGAAKESFACFFFAPMALMGTLAFALAVNPVVGFTLLGVALASYAVAAGCKYAANKMENNAKKEAVTVKPLTQREKELDKGYSKLWSTVPAVV